MMVDLDLRWLGGQGPTYFQAHGAGAAGVGGEAHAPSASTALVPQGYVPPSRYYERVAVLPSSELLGDAEAMVGLRLLVRVAERQPVHRT